MKGRHRFSHEEAEQIRALLRLTRRAAPGPDQKTLRDGLREIGFYISDWRRRATGFTAADFDEIVREGAIVIEDSSPAVGPHRRRTIRPTSPHAEPELAALVDAAIKELRAPRHRLTESLAADVVPAAAGLYAIYGSAATWRELGLGSPPDDRPLYIGKAEKSLAARDLGTHFGDGRTGSSTVRRSFAALLRNALDLRGIPRNPEKPERPANFGLSTEHDQALTAWMRRRLSLAVWPKPPECRSLVTIERAVLERRRPPLNLQDVRTEWRAHVSGARSVMANDARQWARGRGVSV
jgi:hypothetical protein